MDWFCHRHVRFSLFLMVLIGSGCADRIDEIIPAPISATSTAIQFKIISPNVRPAQMVMSISTPDGLIENAKVRFGTQSTSDYLSENFPFICGDYTVTNWSAFDGNGKKVAVQNQEITFSTCENGNIFPEGLTVELTGKEVAYNKFSHVHPELSEQSSGVYSVINLNNTEVIVFGRKNNSRTNSMESITRITASGDVVYHREFNAFSAPLYGTKMIRLNDQSGAVCIYTALGKNNPAAELAQYASYVSEDIIYGVDLSTGNVTWKVRQDDLIAMIPDFMAEGSFDGRAFESTADGGFAYLFYDKNNAGGPQVHRMVKFDNSGNVEWGKIIDQNTSFSRVTSANSIVGHPNGNIALLSRTADSYPYFHLYSSNGDSITTVDFSQTANESLKISFPYVEFNGTADGGYILTTADPLTEKLRLIKLDAAGTLSWQKTYYNEPNTYQMGANSRSYKGIDGNILTAACFNNVTAATYNTYITFYRINSSDGNILAKTQTPIGGQGLPDKNLNGVSSCFETTANDPELDGIVFCGYYTPDGSDVYKQNWIGKIPSDFSYGQEINYPTELLMP